MSKLANALSKLNSLYAEKKGKVEQDTIKQVENLETLAQKKPPQEQKLLSKPQIQLSQQQQTQQQLQAIQAKQPNIIYKDSLPPIFHPLQAKDKKTIRDEKSERKRRQLCMRKAAGDMWEDATLADWPDNDYRLFCGNLGNEVSDEVLANAFRKYASFARARVIRDKRTMKTKGFGFVSFLNPNDYLKAFNEMNGKYVGNRPVKISKGKWKDRSFQSKKKDGLDGKFIKPKIRKIKRIQLQQPQQL